MTEPAGTEDTGTPTQIVEMHGKNVVVRRLTDAQMLQLQYEAQMMQSDDVDIARKQKAISRMHRALLGILVQPSDQDYAEDLMIDGHLQLEDLLAIVVNFSAGEAERRPKVRRGGRR